MAFATTHHVRARLRAERKRRGWDVPRMARELRNAAEYPNQMPASTSIQRNIERWEAGEVTRIGERYRLLYARALHMSEGELFDQAIPPIEQPPAPVSAAGDIAVVRDMLTALTASDRQFGGAHARRYATGYLGTVIEPRLRGHVSDKLRPDLFAVATEFTMRVSGMHLDADLPQISLGLLGTAASMASESGDATLTAWVLSRRGEHEMHQAALTDRADRRTAHIEHALAYTEGAASVARTAPPISRAFILTKRALAWSLASDRAQTERALGAVWGAYEHAGDAEEPDWINSYGWGHLRHEEARCYVKLGLGERAARAAKDSLTVRHDLRPRAFTLGVLAIGHAQAGAVEQACMAGHELLQLARQLRSRRVSLRVAEVLQAVDAHRAVPAVVELHEAARPVLDGSGR